MSLLLTPKCSEKHRLFVVLLKQRTVSFSTLECVGIGRDWVGPTTLHLLDLLKETDSASQTWSIAPSQETPALLRAPRLQRRRNNRVALLALTSFGADSVMEQPLIALANQVGP